MARLIGVEIPDNKRVQIGLTYIFGIGPALSKKILKETGIDADTRVNKLTEDQVNRLTHAIQRSCKVEGDLRREFGDQIKRLIAINSNRGLRHKRGLPVRGQRTHTNARTRKGPRKTVGVVRDKVQRRAVAKPAPNAKK